MSVASSQNLTPPAFNSETALTNVFYQLPAVVVVNGTYYNTNVSSQSEGTYLVIAQATAIASGSTPPSFFGLVVTSGSAGDTEFASSTYADFNVENSFTTTGIVSLSTPDVIGVQIEPNGVSSWTLISLNVSIVKLA